MNPIQKHPNITELFACNRKMLVIMFLFPTNSLISSVLLQNKAIQCVPTSAYYVCPILYFFRQIIL